RRDGGGGSGDGGSAGNVRHVADQLSAYLDGDMKPQAAELVRAHLDGCAACARAADELRAIVAGARSLERPEPPPTLWPAIEGALAEREAPLLDWRRIFVRGFAFGGLAGAAVMILIVVGLGPLGRRLWSPPPVDAPPAPAITAGAPSVGEGAPA